MGIDEMEGIEGIIRNAFLLLTSSSSFHRTCLTYSSCFTSSSFIILLLVSPYSITVLYLILLRQLTKLYLLVCCDDTTVSVFFCPSRLQACTEGFLFHSIGDDR